VFIFLSKFSFIFTMWVTFLCVPKLRASEPVRELNLSLYQACWIICHGSYLLQVKCTADLPTSFLFRFLYSLHPSPSEVCRCRSSSASPVCHYVNADRAINAPFNTLWLPLPGGGCTCWNALPSAVTAKTSLQSFSRDVKTFLLLLTLTASCNCNFCEVPL